MEKYVFLIAVICIAAAYAVYKKRKIYRDIDKLLDCVLNREEICHSEVKEGEFSALVSKISRIQQMMGRQVECAEEEKEKVKSLVSNMSHQLKTPLANLSIYTDILTGQELDDEKKEQISGKIKKQVEKLDWIIGSLTKMVRLEQDVLVFEPQKLLIRQTILDAIDMVYEKVEKKGISIISEPYEDVQLYHNRKWTVECFVNILENAVKYTQPEGVIRIRTSTFL